ncbi:four-carbon acid sugar kinase family protein [Treponema brennaborense]|nr:four-carbon acid sugar kinase family protein [Treponema brennaborense]
MDMAQCLIIADDLTGANATGVLLQKINYQSFTVTDMERFEKSVTRNCDCIIYPTDSRAIDPEVAYERVFIAVKMLAAQDTRIFCKRIDSTLRGNIGTEIDALLDAVGAPYVAFIVPCFPESGRIVCGGYMLVNSVPLHKTEAAIDPKTPVTSSSVRNLICRQSAYDALVLYIDDLQKGKNHLISRIIEAKTEGKRIILFDCISQEDLNLIAEAGIESGIPFICVDPGPFSATVVRKTIIPKEQKKNMKLLAVVGSVNPVARMQIDELFLSQSVHSVCIRTKELVNGEQSRQREIRRTVGEFLAGYENSQISCIYGDGIYPENRVDFSHYTARQECTAAHLSDLINTAFAEITHAILREAPDFAGIYTCGGDITVAVSKQLQVSGIKLIGEVLPLAAYGEFIGGKYAGLKIITKGGMAGDKDAMKRCILYMQERLLL